MNVFKSSKRIAVRTFGAIEVPFLGKGRRYCPARRDEVGLRINSDKQYRFAWVASIAARFNP